MIHFRKVWYFILNFDIVNPWIWNLYFTLSINKINDFFQGRVEVGMDQDLRIEGKYPLLL